MGEPWESVVMSSSEDLNKQPERPETAQEPAGEPNAASGQEGQPSSEQGGAGTVPQPPSSGSAEQPFRRRGPHIVLDDEEEAEIERMLAALSDEDLADQMAAEMRPVREQTLTGKVTGTVVSVGEEDVFVDIGDRDQGVVPKAQFERPPMVGERVELIVEAFDPNEGLYLLRVPGAAELFDWDTVHPGTVLDVRITGQNRGGLEGSVSGVRAFIPASQVALEHVEDLGQFVGQTLRCEVLEVRRSQQSLVLSRRKLLEREREEARKRLLAELQEGQVRRGRVRAVREFGVFVDLGGLDGLIPMSELSWYRVQRAEDVVRPGDEVEVQVLKVDREQGKVSLSLKRLEPSPWEKALTKYPPGSLARGRVTRLTEYGAFVELEPGLEGLVHISELAPHHVTRPSEVVEVGEEIPVTVLEIQPEQRRLRLSRREAIEAAQRQEEEQAVAEYLKRLQQEQGRAPQKGRKLKGGLDP